jgi:hypothetical protein
MSSRLVVLLAATILASSCASAQSAHPQRCPEGERVMLDCSSEVSYQGIDTHGDISALSALHASGRYQDVAIRRVNDNVARYVAAQTRLCRDYNACVIDSSAYRAEAAKTRDLLLEATELAAKVADAKSDAEQNHLLDRMYTSVVPDDQRLEELSFQMALEAQLPPSAGGGTLNVAPGQPLPTGSRVAFTFRTSRDAYLYIFQINNGGEVTVLFPDRRIGTTNPIAAATLTRVPSQGQSFRLNDKDLGAESVYLVASRRAVANLDSAVARVTSGQVSQVNQDSMLANLATIRPSGEGKCQGARARSLELEGQAAADASTCTRTRGLVLDAADGSISTGKPSISTRTSPGDDTIVKVFPFSHVTEEGFRQAQQVYASPQGTRQRGVIVED